MSKREMQTDLLFAAKDLSDPWIGNFGDGEVALFTRGSPDKDTGNEDSVALLTFGEACSVLAVADGLGGCRAGAEASVTALRTLRKALRASAKAQHITRTAILNGLEEANRSVREIGGGAATTIAAAAIYDHRMRPFHVGDSGIMQVGQRGKIKQQTVAHSPVGLAVASGMLDEEEALYHDQRHIVSNALGVTDMRIEIGTAVNLARRDTVLLASDGLFDNLRVEEIVEIVRKGSLATVARQLVDAANARMLEERDGHPSKPDDLSFLLFRRRG